MEGGTKLALVGRTGSGKSSFLLALLRLAPPSSGSSISVDGVDVPRCSLAVSENACLHDPAGPRTLLGDVRFNVDPFNASSDEEVRRALVDAQLEARTSLGQAQVEEGGRNFSLGERQLLCLAERVCDGRNCCCWTRRRRRWMKLSTPPFIRRTFRDATVVCIAHRINTPVITIALLVLDDREVVEDGSGGAQVSVGLRRAGAVARRGGLILARRR